MCRWRGNWQVLWSSSCTQKLGPCVSLPLCTLSVFPESKSYLTRAIIMFYLDIVYIANILKWNLKKEHINLHTPTKSCKTCFLYIYFRHVGANVRLSSLLFQCSTREKKAHRGTSSRKGLSMWLSTARCVFLQGCECFSQGNIISKEQVKMWCRLVLSTLGGTSNV